MPTWRHCAIRRPPRRSGCSNRIKASAISKRLSLPNGNFSWPSETQISFHGCLADKSPSSRAQWKDSPPRLTAARCGKCRISFSRLSTTTARLTNPRIQRLPIEAPSHTHPAIGSRITHSDFVLCQDFIFQPTHVDGCSHQRYADGSAITTVNFKSYTQSIPDPERRLFDFLIRKLKPRPADESD